MATPKSTKNRKRYWFVVPALVLAVLATGWLPIWDIAPQEYPDLIREPAQEVPDAENAYPRLIEMGEAIRLAYEDYLAVENRRVAGQATAAELDELFQRHRGVFDRLENTAALPSFQQTGTFTDVGHHQVLRQMAMLFGMQAAMRMEVNDVQGATDAIGQGLKIVGLQLRDDRKLMADAIIGGMFVDLLVHQAFSIIIHPETPIGERQRIAAGLVSFPDIREVLWTSFQREFEFHSEVIRSVTITGTRVHFQPNRTIQRFARLYGSWKPALDGTDARQLDASWSDFSPTFPFVFNRDGVALATLGQASFPPAVATTIRVELRLQLARILAEGAEGDRQRMDAFGDLLRSLPEKHWSEVFENTGFHFDPETQTLLRDNAGPK